MHTFYDRIRPFVMDELNAAIQAERHGHPAFAFSRLERAHVLAQHSTRLHILIHLHMFQWGLRHNAYREVAGQLWRTVAAAVATPLGLLPTGNSGGSNVSGFKTMPVPTDLQMHIAAANRDLENARAG